MSVSGVNNHRSSPLVGVQSGGLVQTSTGETTTEEPIVENTDTGSGGADTGIASSGDFANPAEEADWLDEQITKIEDLVEHRDDLEELAASGDADAQKLLEELNAYEKKLEQYQERRDALDGMGGNDDLDSDGIVNSEDPDLDGDGLMNTFEESLGLNAYSIDSNGDGVNDKGAYIATQQTYEGRTGHWDINSADWDGDGIVNGDDLPDTLTKYKTNNSGTGSSSGSSGSGTGTDGVGTSSSNLGWDAIPSDAQTVNAADGDATIEGEGAVVYNANGGNVEFSTSDDGKDLIIKSSGGTVTIKDYKDKKIYMEGTAENITTKNFDLNNLSPKDNNGDGIADTGVHFASGINTESVTSNYDFFDGTMPINQSETTDEEIVYDAAGMGGTFDMSGNTNIDGKEINSVTVKKEGSDVVIELRETPDGPVVKKIRLKGALSNVEDFSIDFKLDDKGMYFDSEEVKCRVNGGKGEDYIVVKTGSEAYAGEGSDVISAVGTDDGTVLDGGDGNDFIQGSDGDDHIIGGKGKDLLSGNYGNDSIEGGSGNDIVITADGGAGDTLNGGAGDDMTNATHANLPDAESASFEVGTYDKSGLYAWLSEQKTDASGALLDALTEAGGELDWANGAASAMVGNAMGALLQRKMSDRLVELGGSTAPAEEEETEEETPST